LIHSFENVPYYKNLFNECSLNPYSGDFLNQFKNLPLHTKATIRENFDSIRATNLPESRFVKNSTSGSTGEILWFYSDKMPRIRQALQMRCFDWMNCKVGKKHMMILALYSQAERIRKNKVQLIKSLLKRTRILSALHYSEDDLENYIKEINDFSPQLLTSFPSILYRFASYIKSKKGNILRPKAIQLTGEKLYPFQRDLIEEVFQVKIFNFYGSRDIPMIAMECEEHNGLHIMSENVYLEVLDTNGYPIQEGEGDLVLTDLHNYVFPFIRYKIGDRAVMGQRNCLCGRTLPILEEITGRELDIIRFPNGKEVGGVFWPAILKSKTGIREFQVEQLESDKIAIRFIPGNDFEEVNINYYTDRIQEYSGNDLNISFIKVQEIERVGTSGKFKFVISRKP